MDGLNTMIIQSKLLVHIFIFKKDSINTPPRSTVLVALGVFVID